MTAGFAYHPVMPPRCLPPGPLPPTMVPPPLDAPRCVMHQLPARCAPCRAAQHAARRVALAAQWRPPRCRQRHAQQAIAACPRRPRWIAARRAEHIGHRSACARLAAPHHLSPRCLRPVGCHAAAAAGGRLSPSVLASACCPPVAARVSS